MAKKTYLTLEEIETEGLQIRVSLDMQAVRDYAEAETERGAVFPPVTVFSDGATNWLADGFHRVAMARQQGKKKIAADVRQGTRIDALRWALGANGQHGLRRTNADKAHAVKMAYENREALGLPDVPSARMVADLVGVSDLFTTTQLQTVCTWADATERTGADGKTYQVPPIPTRPTAAKTPETTPPEAAPPSLPPVPTRSAPTKPVPVTAPSPVPVRSAAPSPTAPVPQRLDVDDGQTDGRGLAVPPELMETWNRRKEIKDMATQISQVRSVIRQAQAGEDPLWSEINFSSVLAFLDRSYAEIAAAVPWCVCPMCQGIGCRACKARGLLGETRFEAVVPRELR